MATIARLDVLLDLQDDGFQRGLQNSQKGIDGWAQSIQQNRQQIESFGRGMLGFGALVTGAFVAPIAAGTKAAWSYADSMEQSRVALNAYEKDGRKVDQLMSDLVEYSQSSRSGGLFFVDDLAAASASMLVYGAETENAAEYTEILSRSVGLGTGNWQELNRIVGRVGSTGRMTADDFDMLTKMGYELDESIRNTDMTWQELFAHLDKGIPADALEGQAGTIRAAMAWLQGSILNVGAAFLGLDLVTGEFAEGSLGQTLVNGIEQATAAFNAFAPAVGVIGSVLATVGQHIGRAVDWFLRLPQPILTAIALGTGLTGVLSMMGGAFLLMLPRIADTYLALQRLGGLTGIIGRLGSALRALTLTNPLFWALAAAVGAFLAYRNNFLGFRDAVDSLVDGFKGLSVVQGVTRNVRRFANIGRELSRHWRGAFDAFRASGRGSFVSGLKAAEVALRQASRVAGPFGDHMRSLANWFTVGASVVSDLTYNFDQFRADGLGPVTSALYALGEVFPSLEGVIRPLVGIVASLSDAFDHVTDALGAFFQGKWEDGFESLGLAAEDAWDAITQAFDIGLDLIMAAFDAVDWAGLWDFLRDTGSIIVDRLGDVASALWDWFVGAVTSVDWTGILSTAWDVLSGAGSWIAGKLGEAWTFIRDWFAEQIGRISWGETFQAGIEALSSAGQWIYQKLGDAYENIKTWFALQLSNVEWESLFQSAIVVLASAGSWIVEKLTDISALIGSWFYDQVSGVPWQDLFDLAINALSEAGTWVVTKLGTITESLSTWFSDQFGGVNWENVATTIGSNLRSAVTTGVQAMADIFAILLSWVNDQIRGVDWNDVGSTFAELLVAGIKGVVLLAGMGLYLLGQILLALTDVQWGDVGNAFKEFFKAAVLAVADFFVGFSEKLYEELLAAIESVKWGELGGKIKDLLVNAVTGVGQAMWDKIWSEFDGGGDGIDHNPDFEGGGRGFGTSGGFRGAGGGMAGANLDFGRDLGGGGMFAGLIAEIQSLIDKLGEVPPALQTAQGSITTFVANTIGVMGGWTTGIQAQVNSAMDTLRTRASGATAGALASIASFVAQTIGVMGGWTTGIQAQVNSAMDTLKSRASGGTAAGLSSFTSFVSQTIGVMGGWATGIKNMVNTTMSTMQNRTSSGTSSAKNSFVSFVSQVIGVMGGWSTGIVNIVNGAVSQMVSRARSGGQQMASAFRNGAQDAASAVRSALSQIPGIVASVGGSAASAAFSVGANIGQSMANGMRSALGAIRSAANQMVAEADRAVRARARISSPSRLFTGLGEYLGEGFEQGIRAMIPDVARATSDMVQVPDLSRYGNYGPIPAHAYASRQPATTVHHHHTTQVYAVRSDEWVEMVRQVETAPQRAAEYQSRGFSDIVGIGR